MQEHFIAGFEKLQDCEQAMILSALQRLVMLMDAKTFDVVPILVEAGPIEEATEKFLESNKNDVDQKMIEAETNLKCF